MDSCHDLDVKILTLPAVLLALALSAAGADCPKNQPKTEATLIELEQNWAAALSRKDADAVACMVAGEFENADVDGSLHTAARCWSTSRSASPALTTSRKCARTSRGTSDLRADLQRWSTSGKVVARVRFTDVFTYRDGRWQALAGHETLLGEASR